MEKLKRVHARNLVRWAADKPEVVVLSGDLTKNTEVDGFRDAYPERFFSMGMAEQNMLSFAGGLAREGFEPFVHSFAVFLYRRPFDQLSMSVAYPNLRVRLFGFLPGLTTPGGVTHQAIDDLGVLRTVPNMTILVTADATDVESVLDVAHAVDGPVYIRMQRGEIPRLFSAAEPMQFGRARVLSTGDDVTLLTCGVCTEEAMRATVVLRQRGVSIQHLHVTTLKPFDDPLVAEAVARVHYGVITMENHTVMNGLGSAVAAVIAENGLGARLVRMGLADTYAYGASHAYLMRKYELDAAALVRRVEAMIGERLNIGEDELAGVRLTATHSDAKAEGL